MPIIRNPKKMYCSAPFLKFSKKVGPAMMPTAVTKHAKPMFLISGLTTKPKCPNTNAANRMPDIPRDRPFTLTRPNK